MMMVAEADSLLVETIVIRGAGVCMDLLRRRSQFILHRII